MRVENSLSKKLNLSAASNNVVNTPLDHFPLLTADKALSDASSELTRWTASSFDAGHHVHANTITMPRRGFGPRPVTLMASNDRVMLGALVDDLENSLPPATRGQGKWPVFDKFGMPDTGTTDTYVVNIDIAACYEYIDHDLLRSELILHTMNVPVVECLIELLTQTFGRQRGLPQMMRESDILADTYLHAIERFLQRQGHPVLRYADDMKVLAPSWAAANAIIEETAEVARKYGLVLSSQKTNIVRASTLKERDEELNKFLQLYFERAKDELSGFEYVRDFYGDWEEVEIEPEEEEAREEAYRKLLTDLSTQPADGASHHSQFVGIALRGLQVAKARISNTILQDIVFRQPVRLDSVASYLLSRSEPDLNWSTLRGLVEMERQSPWAKVWLLHLADSLPSIGGGDEAAVLKWAGEQITDKHEIVRAETCWLLAGAKPLTTDKVGMLYESATLISRPAVVAALARQGESESSAISKALKSDSPLHSKAFAWGAAN